ncbi:hypothetical protein [Magnetospirillum sp. SS-4]|uniref:hypothetical protein n=1 Tax=Magnetospirillum sp. SS-4 TaxID=2681465 RepID=UPI00157352D6|nr:hypothetical protein [Magnetospirillum sp. SS-4]
MAGSRPPVTPARPAFGAPCNGCGVCCLEECCPLAIVVHRRRRGPCPSLIGGEDGEIHRCGLLIRAPRLLRPLVARWIAAGTGCDSG